MELIIATLIVLFAGTLYNIIPPYIKRKKTEISFRQSIVKTNLPIVAVKSGDMELHMLVDSGSDFSHIDKNILHDIKASKLEGSNKVHSIGGVITADYYFVNFDVKGENIDEICLATDFGEALKSTEEECGYKVHGILGIPFLINHNYILDFNNFIAYQQ